MTKLLSRMFVRDHTNTSNPRVRAAYGFMSSIVGIVVNLLLFAGKFFVGLYFGLVSIQADAFNNLSDAGSSIISLVTFRIASKPADRDHPYGHARIEYASSLLVSCIILFIGFELLTSSVDAIRTPSTDLDEIKILSMIILGVSILSKLWLFLFYRSIGKKIDSGVLTATATDSLTDSISTTAVLVTSIIMPLTQWYILDGIVGCAVAVFIMFAGIRILWENIGAIIGRAPVDEVVKSIKGIISHYPDALGIHDMMVHNYGPGHIIASLHIEVDGAKDIFELHDVIDNIERHINEELGITCTVHMDPIVVGDSVVDNLKSQTMSKVHEIDERMNIHDFRYVRGTTHHNLIFDIAVPFEVKHTDSEIIDMTCDKIKEINEAYCCVITIDRV